MEDTLSSLDALTLATSVCGTASMDKLEKFVQTAALRGYLPQFKVPLWRQQFFSGLISLEMQALVELTWDEHGHNWQVRPTSAADTHLEETQTGARARRILQAFALASRSDEVASISKTA